MICKDQPTKQNANMPTTITIHVNQCTSCIGTGKAKCKRCNGVGHKRCDECEKMHQETPWYSAVYRLYKEVCCGGTGVEQCDRCDATGLLECRKCDGKGALGPAEENEGISL